MKTQMTLSAAFAVIALFLAPTFASAQMDCDPDVAHAHLRSEIRACSASGIPELGCSCVCDRGYHTRDGGAPSASNPCVRDEPSWGSSRDPLCGFGGERNSRDICICPASLSPRISRHLGTIEASVVRAMQAAGTIEDREFDMDDGRLVAVWDCSDPFALAGAAGSPQDVYTSGLREAVRVLCAAPEAATDEQLIAACTETRALIDSIGPRTTIHYGDRDYTFNEFVNDILVPKFGEIEERLSALEAAVAELRDDVDDHEVRISALERGWRSFASALHLRVGGFGLLGTMVNGLATGAGGVSGELLVRFGDLPIGAYGRLYFGGQHSAWEVGSSFYVAGGGGFTVFVGGREDTTFSLGYHGTTFVDPYTAGDRFPHDSIGVANGAQLLVSLPIPGLGWVRIEPSLIVSYAERRLMDQGGVYRVPQDVAVEGTLGIVFQPAW